MRPPGFFSSRRRHTRYWRDWSSDVCSSDLTGARRTASARTWRGTQPRRAGSPAGRSGSPRCCPCGGRDRKSVVEGKSVDLGGRRIIKKKKELEDTRGIEYGKERRQIAAHQS